MDDREYVDGLSEAEMAALLAGALSSQEFTQVELTPRLSANARPDLVGVNGIGQAVIVEVKATSPLTIMRVESVISQIRSYEQAFIRSRTVRPKLILALPFGLLTRERNEAFESARIEVWDHYKVTEIIEGASDQTLGPELARVKHAYLTFKNYGKDPDFGSNLSNRLRGLSGGRDNWSAYQKLCAEIITYLFCPPLELPIYESSNATKVNRRDIILPNYATEGFWSFLHRAYRAEYVVVDAKNYRSSVKKDQVLQIANYLSEAGTGLLGLILTRRDEDRGALVTRREQWLVHRKLVLVMGDNDVHQMIENKRAGSAPEEVLRQKIQDFRLAI